MKHRGAKLTHMPTLEYDTVIASMVHLHGSRITSQPYLLISYKNIYNIGEITVSFQNRSSGLQDVEWGASTPAVTG